MSYGITFLMYLEDAELLPQFFFLRLEKNYFEQPVFP